MIAYNDRIWSSVVAANEILFISEHINCNDLKGTKVRFHAAWGINHKDTCPDYSPCQISSIQDLLVRS